MKMCIYKPEADSLDSMIVFIAATSAWSCLIETVFSEFISGPGNFISNSDCLAMK